MRRLSSSILLSLAVLSIGFLVLAACGSTVELGSDAANVIVGSADANTLVFERDIIRAGALLVGDKAVVKYDADRLGACRGEQNGRPAWSITGHYQLAGGPAGSFEAGGYSPSGGTQPAEIPLAGTGELQVWFEVTNRWGCQAWDSDYGRNFRFTVARPAVVRFEADWTVSTESTLRAGAPVTVQYDLKRLPRCRQTYNGMATWEITVGYRFDGGASREVPVTAISGMDRVAAPATFTAPAGARELELWFHNSDRAGCSDWDSDYGRNFRFKVR